MVPVTAVTRLPSAARGDCPQPQPDISAARQTLRERPYLDVGCLADLAAVVPQRLAVHRDRGTCRGDLQIRGITPTLILEHLAHRVVLLLLLGGDEVLARSVPTLIDDTRASREQRDCHETGSSQDLHSAHAVTVTHRRTQLRQDVP